MDTIQPRFFSSGKKSSRHEGALESCREGGTEGGEVRKRIANYENEEHSYTNSTGLPGA